jgi:hypothetical protein
MIEEKIPSHVSLEASRGRETNFLLVNFLGGARRR